MPTRIPFNALQIFCTVVSNGSFRGAAQKLNVTPGAVSRQIQVLEEHLKEVLFDRATGGMARLSPAGSRLYGRVAQHMDGIADSMSGTTNTIKRATVWVDTSVTLAMHWLIPLIPQFSARYPDTQVQVRTTDGPINPAAPVDIFIRRDQLELRGLAHKTFMEEHSVLVATPSVAANLSGPRPFHVSSLQIEPLIGVRSRTDLWPQWNKAQGIGDRLEPTVEFDNTVLAIQAALQGLGALVVPEIFVSAMVVSGALVLLTPARVKTGTYSYSVGRQQDSYRTAMFTEWLDSYCSRLHA